MGRPANSTKFGVIRRSSMNAKLCLQEAINTDSNRFTSTISFGTLHVPLRILYLSASNHGSAYPRWHDLRCTQYDRDPDIRWAAPLVRTTPHPAATRGLSQRQRYQGSASHPSGKNKHAARVGHPDSVSNSLRQATRWAGDTVWRFLTSGERENRALGFGTATLFTGRGTPAIAAVICP